MSDVIVSKPVLKEYLDFVDATEKRGKELLERVDQECKRIGCKSNEEEPFMDCNKGCPLFYAWQFLDNLLKAISSKEEGEVKVESGAT